MPFGGLLDALFEAVIAPALTAAGYDVSRADTTPNQRAIMQDVVEGVARADLIVADLTGRNPNVFYELGIAHALRKRTILLAQRADDIPFDLTAYRALIYSIQVQTEPSIRLEETLTDTLAPLLEAISRGEIVFANPFTDYEPAQPQPVRPEGADEGVLDLLVRLEEDAPRYIATLNDIAAVTKELGDDISAVTEEMKSPPATGVGQFALVTAAKAAAIWDRGAERLRPIVADRLVPLSLSVEQGILAEVRAALLTGDEERLARVQSMLGDLARVSADTSGSTLRFAEITRRTSQWASALRAPGERLASVLEQIAAQLDRIAALPSAVTKVITINITVAFEHERDHPVGVRDARRPPARGGT